MLCVETNFEILSVDTKLQRLIHFLRNKSYKIFIMFVSFIALYICYNKVFYGPCVDHRMIFIICAGPNSYNEMDISVSQNCKLS